MTGGQPIARLAFEIVSDRRKAIWRYERGEFAWSRKVRE
jgi:hypothetical protein